jgi:hypothetical protein
VFLFGALSSLQGGHTVASIFSSPWGYAVLNFGILLLFVIWSLRRILVVKSGASSLHMFAIGYHDTAGGVSAEQEVDSYPAVFKILAGDFITGCLLAGALAVAFAACSSASVANLPGPSLVHIDLGISLVCLYHGVLVAVLASLISPERTGRALLEVPRRLLLAALQSAYAVPRAALATTSLLLRVLAVPLLLLTAPVWLALGTLGFQTYFAGSARYCTGVMCLQAFSLQHVAVLGGALLALVFALVTVALALGLLLFKWRVVENSLRFLGLIGFVALIPFWIFGLLLSAINAATLWLHVSERVPFAQPEVATVISFATCALSLFFLLWRFRARPLPTAPRL